MNIQPIAIGSVFLDLENPRHEPYQSEEEVIEYLCRNDYVYVLAQDIVKVGLNPMEIMAVIPKNNDEHHDPTYVIAEGNRRLCALKLLIDPELAPSDERKNFKILSKQWDKFDKISAIVFEHREAVDEWLGRIHGGLQGGIGRKQWSSEQKTRFTGDIKNLMAQQLLDYAQKKSMITPEERVNKISTVQRFISNPLIRDALGVDTSNSNELQRIRSEPEFDLILRKFIEDLKSGAINTRFNSPEIQNYSHNLRKIEGVGTDTIFPQTLNAIDKDQNLNNPNDKPKSPVKPRYLKNQEATENMLKELNNYKLTSVYNSLHRLAVADHCPLLTVGLWAFLESITALNGRNSNTDFQGFLSNDKLEKLSLGNKSETKALRECLQRIAQNGNTTKHDGQAASFNGQQLINDFESLHPLIRALAQDCIKQSTNEK